MSELDPRYARPCGHYSRTDGRSGATPTRLYLQGPRCKDHTPSALAGEPEPPPGYCAPARCYCGESSCPAYHTYGRLDPPDA